ncbi:MAG TPA: glutamate--tRNA ligase family protein [Candidatus Nanoarchaeia archaeon]|nr:glutamate--tRNA ligase family protein [Candidatus Nanoarchaeia archaeon]
MKNLSEKARAYALKNALAYNGKAQQGSVISALFNEGLKKSEIPKYMKEISKIVSEVNSLSLDEQEKEFEKIRDDISERHGRIGLQDLLNAKKGKVIMRFAPSPSGPLHIGHALTASLSYLYVKKYGGKFYVRIEDTNPENILPSAYKMIESESTWLFNNEAEIIIQSYRMEIYYEYVEKLIKKKAVYVCICQKEEFEKYVESKENCPCRTSDSKENLERWRKMLSSNSKNNFQAGEAVLRFKSGMKNKNPAFRDFPLARINETKHAIQKNKYRVWPLMNLAVAIDDIETKITHIIRGKDHRDNAKRQEMIHKVLGKKSPWAGFLGKFNFKDMELSTTKFRKEIESGVYSGWDDLRLPTIASLKKQGYKPEAFWKFAEQIGLSENDKTMDKREFFLLLDNFNK